LTHLQLAFSRDQAKKVYIQHKIAEDASLMNDLLINKKGYFYLCGPTWPVSDVKEALIKGFMESGITQKQGNELINKLKDEERYILEVY
jgi:sulfite reductase (NADPH) flavoprotein alpha-component